MVRTANTVRFSLLYIIMKLDVGIELAKALKDPGHLIIADVGDIPVKVAVLHLSLIHI